ncbi:MAG: DUF3108 domain-containing protein [Ignavibacteria bacterium]|nr:DUF3108 domain-containing protein [Ignavibacteria bacterium]
MDASGVSEMRMDRCLSGRRSFAVLMFFLLSVSSVVKSQEQVFTEKEELNYIVSYGFIELGEVRIEINSVSQRNGAKHITASCDMKSYSGIPLVELDSRFESDMIYSGGELYSKEFRAVDRKKEGVVEIRYVFEYDSGYVRVKKKFRGATEIDKNMEFDRNLRFQDGLSLFYLSRLNSFETRSRQIPVFMNESEATVSYYFSAVPEEVELDEIGVDVNSIKCTGSANFVGVFGLTGEFAGWFTDDNARVPVMAKMNVLIGNVTLELKSYVRKGWSLKK